MISPSFWTDERIGRLSRDARLLLIALHNYADDEGRLVYSPARIKLQVFPYDNDITPSVVVTLMAQLSEHRFVVKYDVNGGTYLQITDFRNNQRVDRPTPSKLPPPPTNVHSQPKTPLQLLDSIMPGRVSTVDRDWLYDVIDTYGEQATAEALRECKRRGSEVRSVRKFVEAVAARIKNEGNGRHTAGSHMSQEELEMLERARRRTRELREQGLL